MIARRYFVSGMVQGVGFRYFAQRSAAKHQIRGFIRNLSDGRVEAFVEGSERAVIAFKEDIAAGPPFSNVEMLEEIVEDPTDQYSTFRIEKDNK
ncbi:MAG TPA: acylphosphatase [Pyrinomonadaceae bacterium]|nr:acylphosphatase [Pyrinomonadaceae bacterium]